MRAAAGAAFDSYAKMLYNLFIALLTPCSSGFVDAGGVIFFGALHLAGRVVKTVLRRVDVVERM